jgi:hypothetical protein
MASGPTTPRATALSQPIRAIFRKAGSNNHLGATKSHRPGMCFIQATWVDDPSGTTLVTAKQHDSHGIQGKCLLQTAALQPWQHAAKSYTQHFYHPTHQASIMWCSDIMQVLLCTAHDVHCTPGLHDSCRRCSQVLQLASQQALPAGAGCCGNTAAVSQASALARAMHAHQERCKAAQACKFGCLQPAPLNTAKCHPKQALRTCNGTCSRSVTQPQQHGTT